MIKKLFFLFVVLTLGATEKLPSFVKLCKRNDPELAKCFVNSTMKIMPYLKKGIPEMGLQSIDPLFWDNVKFNDDALSNLNIHGQLFNLSIFNVEQIEIKNFTIDLDKVYFAMDLNYPFLRFLSSYQIKGKVLLFELEAYGNLKLNATDVVASAAWSGKTITKNKKQHVKFTTANIKIKSAKLHIYLGQLFKDNAQLTETVNAALNANIDSLFEDFVPIVEEALGQTSKNIFNTVYQKFSIDELYPSS